MILILSEESDFSTTQVIEWLNIMNKKWIRINREDEISINYIGNDIQFLLKDINFLLSEIKSFWYRRGFINISKLNLNINELDNFLDDELNGIVQFLYYKLTILHHLDSIKNSSINKLIVNSIAKDLEICTPNEYVFSNKKSLEELINNTDIEYITKAINGSPTLLFQNFITQNFTTKIDINKINSNTFFPSLIQNKIDKKYELRIYYFLGEFYCMAIFSQRDRQTSIDFRNYNTIKPNRRVPFNLPNDVKIKLTKLMSKLSLDTGSIDMIVTPDNEYVFLEVNPVGQFSMTSFPCNYNLEKKIAKYLSNEN